MNFKPWYSRAYAYLAIYLLLATLISGPMIYLALIFLVLVSATIFLYLYLEDMFVFYLYVFLALVILAMDFIAAKQTLENVAIMYMLMLPLLLHIIEMHFGPYEKVHTNTYIIYITSTALSFLTVMIFAFTPRFLNTYAMAGAIIAAMVIYYLLTAQDGTEE